MSRGIALCFLMVCLPAAGGAAVAGQDSGGGLYVGTHGGAMFDAAPAFSESICPSETTATFGLHVGHEFLRFLGVEGGTSLHTEDPDFCVNGLHPPPPENGTRTLRMLRENVTGYPFGTPEGRVFARSPEIGGVASARLGMGGAWIPAKDIGALLAALGVRLSFGRLRAGLDLERWWFDVPFTDLEQTFVDGELVSEREMPGEFSENPVLLRVAVEWVVF